MRRFFRISSGIDANAIPSAPASSFSPPSPFCLAAPCLSRTVCLRAPVSRTSKIMGSCLLHEESMPRHMHVLVVTLLCPPISRRRCSDESRASALGTGTCLWRPGLGPDAVARARVLLYCASYNYTVLSQLYTWPTVCYLKKMFPVRRKPSR